MSPKDLIVSDSLQKRLTDIKHTALEDIKNKDIVNLAKDSSVTENEDSIIISLPLKARRRMNTTRTESPRGLQGITTSSTRLNQLFGDSNGIPRKSVIEFSGAPGSGKTQLCMTLALNVQLPIEKGGLDGQCIYIDTEGGLTIERFYQMATKGKEDDKQAQQKLGKINYYRVLDHLEMIALVRQLPDILQVSPKVKLLIVDSVAYHLRLNIRQNRIRVGLVSFIGETLAQMASQFDLAIVVTSHVSTDIKFGRLRPTLGDTWAQWCTKRVMLTRRRQQRYASIYDPSQRTSYMMEPFTIAKYGIEDADEETLARVDLWQDSETKEDITLAHRAQHQGNGFTTWSAIYDSEDIWNEPGGFTDEVLSEMPLDFVSTGTNTDNCDNQNGGVCQKTSYLHQNMQHTGSTSITASVLPPTSTRYLPQTFRRKQSSPSEDNSITLNNSNKKARHDENANRSSSPMDNAKDEDQNNDDWGPGNDEEWLTIAELSPPSV